MPRSTTRQLVALLFVCVLGASACRDVPPVTSDGAPPAAPDTTAPETDGSGADAPDGSTDDGAAEQQTSDLPDDGEEQPTVTSETAAAQVAALRQEMPGGRVVLASDFDQLTPGGTDEESLGAAFGVDRITNADDGLLEITADDDGQVMRVHSRKQTSGGAAGLTLQVPLAQTHERACLTYRMRVDDRWDWASRSGAAGGGKLPGLSGTVSDGDLSDASGGGKPNGTAWSGRMMWRAGGPYQPGDLVSYIYHLDQPGKYGEDVPWRRQLQRGVWSTVAQCYEMNDPGQANGVLRAWFDGELVAERRDLRYRDSAELGIDVLHLAVFRGGGAGDVEIYGASHDGWIDFDDFVIVADG
jgi:hypothetical protein